MAVKAPVAEASQSIERTKVITDGRVAYVACKALGSSSIAALLKTREEGNKAADLVQLYAYTTTVVENIVEVLKRVQGVVEELKSSHIPEAFERENLQTLSTKDGDRLTVVQKYFASLPAEKREAGFAWLRENGHEAMIVETVNSQTLSAFAKAELAEGRELPEEIFTTHIKPSVSLTRGKQTKAMVQ